MKISISSGSRIVEKLITVKEPWDKDSIEMLESYIKNNLQKVDEKDFGIELDKLIENMKKDNKGEL